MIHMLRLLFFRLTQKLFQAVNRDHISMQRITKRGDLQKVGSSYGGWVVPSQSINENSICYCVGCGDDISFDMGLIERFECKVYAFDPTPRSIQYVRETVASQPNYHFFDFGIWDENCSIKFYAPQNPKHISHSIINLQKTHDFFEAKVKKLIDVMGFVAQKES
jgi:hypothetical protein